MKNISLPFLNTIKNQDEKMNDKLNNKIAYYKKIIKPSSDELKKHNQYLKNNLKKNYY